MADVYIDQAGQWLNAIAIVVLYATFRLLGHPYQMKNDPGK